MRLNKPVVSASVILIIAGIFAFSCKFSFAQEQNPKRGSVTFGAKKAPQVQTAPQYKAFKNMFADVAEQVIPTVVSITSTKIDTVVYRDPFSQFFWGSPFDEFFGAPPNRRVPQQQEQHIPKSGFGSGVIVSKDGYILTNYHVVGKADEIVVTMADEREFEAEIVGVDSLSDVAVIKIKEDVKDLPVAFLGDSDNLRPGDWCMAIGNPFNLSSTVTTGIISAVGRSSVGAGMTQYRNFIQTDAAINPGNSGGALVNIDGELIGINTMIYTRSGGYMGIGFAIPIDMAKWIMEEIIYNGEVQRGWLGVQISDIDQDKREALGLKTRKGVLINDIFAGQPADKAGIKVGDVVISIDGRRTESANELMFAVAGIAPGKKVPVKIVRNGKEMTMQVVLEKRDDGKISANNFDDSNNDQNDAEKDDEADFEERLGISVGNLSETYRQKLNLPNNADGVLILDVQPTSRAARSGLRQFDLIRKVTVSGKQFNVSTVADFRKAVKNLKSGESVMFYVQRGNSSFFVAYKAA
ncbi:MAG: DegQ family serine endoprotease [Fibrobacterota bacterium]